MKCWNIVGVLGLFSLLPVFALEPFNGIDENGLICRQKASGKCVAENEIQNCMVPLEKLDCSDGEKCCKEEEVRQSKDFEAAVSLVRKKKSCKQDRKCTEVGGKCISKNGKCDNQKNDTLCSGKQCTCCIGGSSIDNRLANMEFIMKYMVDSIATLTSNISNISEDINHGVQSIPSPSMLEDAAYNKTTVASPIYSNCVSGKAVDNSDITLYHSAQLNDPWWMVDLGAVRTIFHIIILPRQHNAVSQRFSNIEIRIGETRQTTGDFTSYTLLHFYKGPYKMGEGRLMYTFCSGVTGRYLSVQIKGKKDFLEIRTFQAIALKI